MGFKSGCKGAEDFWNFPKVLKINVKFPEFVDSLGNIPGMYGLFATLVPYKFDSICDIMFQLFQPFPCFLENKKQQNSRLQWSTCDKSEWDQLLEDLEAEMWHPISCEHIVLQGGDCVRSTKCMTEIVLIHSKIVINWKCKSLEEFDQIPYIIFLLKLAYYSCNLKQESPIVFIV